MAGINKLLFILCFFVAFSISAVAFPEGAISVLFCSILSAIIILILKKAFEENSVFLINLFLAALLCRIILATVIYMLDWQGLFGGGDAGSFDIAGYRLALWWAGEIASISYGVDKARSLTNPGWGMNYLVGAIYYVIGRNSLFVQFFSCVVGAATAPAIYFCANKIFQNNRVAKFSALAVAFFPSMILWSCQMLKDGFIIFLLSLAMVCIIYLQEKFNFAFVIILALSLFGILSLRFYVFYVVVIVIVGAIVVGKGHPKKPFIKRFGVILLVGTALFYIGAGTRTDTSIQYPDLEGLKQSRDEQAKAGSGFGRDIDISTTEGVVTILPIGLVFILFAPFPWQMTNVSQLMALPDMLLWWASVPFLISGLWYTFKHRLRSSVAILTFTLMLTTAYAIFQGNVGTAYRQRTQIQIFLFIFVAVGLTLRQERKEQTKLMRQRRRKQFENRLQART